MWPPRKRRDPRFWFSLCHFSSIYSYKKFFFLIFPKCQRLCPQGFIKSYGNDMMGIQIFLISPFVQLKELREFRGKYIYVAVWGKTKSSWKS